MSSDYEAFIAGKSAATMFPGIDVRGDDLAPHLFPFQRDLTRWALRKGRACIFADTGLGKTEMQIEWTRHVGQKGRVLILTPLAVAQQTVRKAATYGVPLVYARSDNGAAAVVTNYEMLHAFDPDDFVGVVLDESSILKSFDGRTRTELIRAFANTPYRLALTATPAPNDFTELGNHAEFMGVKTRQEMLAEYFVHDGGSTQDWRIKGHAVEPFWRWVATWGAVVKKPSDLGYDDGAFKLPPLEMHDHVIPMDHAQAASVGRLFLPHAATLNDQRAARRASMSQRVEMAAALCEGDEPMLVWCELNAEGDMLAESIPDAVQVSGSDSIEWKQNAALWFAGLYAEECTCSARSGEPTTANITGSISTSGPSEQLSSRPATTPLGEPSTSTTPPSESGLRSKRANGPSGIQASDATRSCGDMESMARSMTGCSPRKAAAAPSAADPSAAIPTTGAESGEGSTSIIATIPVASAGCSARPATWDSASSAIARNGLSAQPCTCGRLTARSRRVLISKSSIFGYGMNFQVCARSIFVGASHSYEQTYQAIRRCWRFGQTRPVHVHFVYSEAEGLVVENYRRKEADAERMAAEMLAHVGDAVRSEVRSQSRRWNPYKPRKPLTVPEWLVTEDA